MSELKVVNHEPVVVDASGSYAQPPPYSPPQPQPQPGYYGPPNVAPGAPPNMGNVIPVVPVIVSSPVGSQPAAFTCRSCQMQIVSRVEYKASMLTHMFAAFLCLFGCWPCVCVPYCMDSCNNAEHYCPNCGAYIGSYQR